MNTEPKHLIDKAAIITGASRGIGRAIALTLARSGAQVVAAGRDRSLLDSLAREIEDAGGVAVTAALDLRLPESPQALVEIALAAFGRIDILVNNAGATKRGDFLKLTEEDWADGFALKFFGGVRLTRAAWPEVIKTHGSIVNIAGIGGRTPGAQFTIGGSVNAAILSFTKAMADAGVHDGVQVNAVNPGYVRTDRFARTVAAFAAEHGMDISTALETMLRNAKVARFGEPGDIAALVEFIVSARGRFLQGAIIDMDGGQNKTL